MGTINPIEKTKVFLNEIIRIRPTDTDTVMSGVVWNFYRNGQETPLKNIYIDIINYNKIEKIYEYASVSVSVSVDKIGYIWDVFFDILSKNLQTTPRPPPYPYPYLSSICICIRSLIY